MESITTCNAAMKHSPAGYALVEVAIELAVAGAKALRNGIAGLVKAQRMARIRHEMYAMSDRSLSDIGLHRDEIDRMFR
jgi:uncharacterized protein YjiS (DUF1127 family)